MPELTASTREAARRLGAARDVLWILETGDTRAETKRSAIWGAVNQPGEEAAAARGRFPLLNRAFRIVERLWGRSEANRIPSGRPPCPDEPWLTAQRRSLACSCQGRGGGGFADALLATSRIASVLDCHVWSNCKVPDGQEGQRFDSGSCPGATGGAGHGVAGAVRCCVAQRRKQPLAPNRAMVADRRDA